MIAAKLNPTLAPSRPLSKEEWGSHEPPGLLGAGSKAHGSPIPPPKSSRKHGWRGQANVRATPPLVENPQSTPCTRTRREATYPGPFNGLQTAGIPGITAARGGRSLVDRGNAVHSSQHDGDPCHPAGPGGRQTPSSTGPRGNKGRVPHRTHVNPTPISDTT